MKESLMLTWAARYLKEGWSLIPLKPRSKEPLIPWTEFQKRKATLEEVKEWMLRCSGMNIGVVTGNVSSLVVVDLDGVKGLKFGQSQHITSQVVAKTGKGKQLFYKWTEHVDNSVSKLAPGVDVRGDGGYVVVPPSQHPNGKRYRWLNFIPQNLKNMPSSLYTAKSVITDMSIAKKPDGWIAKALEEMKIGNIDDTLTSILGRLRHDGYSAGDSRTLLSPHAERAGATPGHLEEKIRNVWSRYEPKQEWAGGLQQRTTNTTLTIHSPDSYDQYIESKSAVGVTECTRTGFTKLDGMLESGLKSERLFTIAARTGTGKTNFAIAVARSLCEAGKRVLFFSTEFTYQKIWDRYLATLKRPEVFREHKLFVCDGFAPSVEQVEEAIRQIKPDVFIFDHINHLSDEIRVLSDFMQGCNFLQRKYNCQGIMIAQLNRQADWVENGERVTPRMSMIKGSGTIEQASSRVLLLSETRVTPEGSEIVGVLDKNDSGDKGMLSFALRKDPYRIVEI